MKYVIPHDTRRRPRQACRARPYDGPSARESAALRRVMALILRLSNFLNCGTYHAGAFGFKVASLKQLGSFRSNVPGEAKTLLHAIVRMVSDDHAILDGSEALLSQLRPAVGIEIGSVIARTSQVGLALSHKFLHCPSDGVCIFATSPHK